jgi:hypothetical protein
MTPSSYAAYVNASSVTESNSQAKIAPQEFKTLPQHVLPPSRPCLYISRKKVTLTTPLKTPLSTIIKMSGKPPLSIWSIKPKKKKKLGSPISSADTPSNNSNVNPRKRGYDALIKSEKNGDKNDGNIKNESDDDDIDQELEDMFGVGITAQSNRDEAQKQLEKRDKRARSRAVKIEDDAK